MYEARYFNPLSPFSLNTLRPLPLNHEAKRRQGGTERRDVWKERYKEEGIERLRRGPGETREREEGRNRRNKGKRRIGVTRYRGKEINF